MSGGRTPWAMLAILGELEEMPWAETELFQVDERIASPGSEDRNLTHMVLGLSMDHQAALRPMPVTQRDLDGAARDYEDSLPEPLDLVHLGLGPDGHTASLVPGDPVLEVSDRRVAITETAYQGHRRMTLTYPALDAARQIVWLVTGPDKREALLEAAGRRHLDPGRPGREREHDRRRRRRRRACSKSLLSGDPSHSLRPAPEILAPAPPAGQSGPMRRAAISDMPGCGGDFSIYGSRRSRPSRPGDGVREAGRLREPDRLEADGEEQDGHHVEGGPPGAHNR